MSSIASLFVRIGADVSGFQEGLNKVQNSMSNIGGKMTNMGSNLSAKVSAPIAGLGSAAVVIGAKFDEQMSKVAAVSGTTGEEFEKLRNQAKELGATTKYSASEAASGMEFLARAGFNTTEIMSSMPAMLDLAASSAIDLGSAADITSNIMSGFGIEASDAGKVADILAKTSASANTDVAQLGEAMKYAAPVAKSMGLGIEETAAMIGKMSDAGIQASMAGTALRGGLTRLANPTNEAAELMAEMGFNAFDAQGKMLPMGQLLTNLQTGLKGMSEQQKSTALATVFGQEAMSGWMAVLDQGIPKFTELEGKIKDSSGAANKMAETMSDNAAGGFKELMSALEGLAIEISDILTPIVIEATSILTEWTRKFSELSPVTKKTILIIGGVVAAIGPLLLVVGQAIALVPKLIAGAKALGVALTFLSANPVGLTIAAIGGLITIGFLVVKHWDIIKEKLSKIFGGIGKLVKGVIDGVKKVFNVGKSSLNVSSDSNLNINPSSKVDTGASSNSNQNVNINVYNPKGESSEQSIKNEMKKMQYLSGQQVQLSR